MIDVASLQLLVAVASAAAFIWLLIRSEFGRQDVAEGEAVVALALISATIPAWAAWQCARLLGTGATTGELRAGLAVDVVADRLRGADRMIEARKVTRLALHPASLPVWGWLIVITLLPGLPWLPLAPIVVAVGVALGGVVSTVMFLGWPAARPPHDLIAGTRLVVRH